MNWKSFIAGCAVASAAAGIVFALLAADMRGTIEELEAEVKAMEARPGPGRRQNVAAGNQPEPKAKPSRSGYHTEIPEHPKRAEPSKDRLQAWAEAVQQIEDAERKQNALNEILAALSSTDPQEISAGLTAYLAARGIEFDRTAFRPAIVALLPHADPVFRQMALDAMPTLPRVPEDVALVSALAGDPDFGVRKRVVGNLFWLTDRNLEGPEGQTVLGILESAETPTRSLIDTMWGAKFSPELEKKLVEFARRPRAEGDEELPYYAIYSCLSTQNNKGPACVDVLLERLTHEDSFNVGGRAAWGLAYGVQSGLGLEKKIADTAVKVWRNRTNDYLRKNLMECIAQYGDAGHAAALNEIAAAPAISPAQKSALVTTADAILARVLPGQ